MQKNDNTPKALKFSEVPRPQAIRQGGGEEGTQPPPSLSIHKKKQ